MQIKTKILGCAAALATATALIAGGIVLDIGKPVSPEAQAKNALLVVHGWSCIGQENTTISGTAEGVVNGRHESLHLTLIPLKAQGVYAVTRQWPAEGNWVLTFVMQNPRFASPRSAMVKLDNGSVDWAAVQQFNGAPSKTQIEAALNSTALASR